MASTTLLRCTSNSPVPQEDAAHAGKLSTPDRGARQTAEPEGEAPAPRQQQGGGERRRPAPLKVLRTPAEVGSAPLVVADDSKPTIGDVGIEFFAASPLLRLPGLPA
jgi:hypothetical protein